MSVPFLDSNPAIINELRAMDHNSKEYKKNISKILLEIGGIGYLFNYIKSTEQGDQIRRKYFRNLIATGAFLLSLFVWIILAVVLTGGRDPDQFQGADLAFFIGFIAIEIASIVVAMLFAFRCRRILLNGVSFMIDSYKCEGGGSNGNTLNNYKFQRAKINTISIVVGILVFVVFFGIRALGNGTINTLFSSRTKEFSKAGLTIMLTQDFQEKDVVSQTATYVSSKYIVMTLKEEFTALEQTGLPSDISLKEYAEAIIESNSLDATVEGNESRPYFKYLRQSGGKDYTYLAIAYKGSDAFWVVTFACESKNYETSQEQFMKWAGTVKVS